MTQTFSNIQNSQPPAAGEQAQPANPLGNFLNLAGPLLNNVLQQNNLNAPLSSLVDEEEKDEGQSLFMQMTSQLSLSEMLAIFQGNLDVIQGLHPRLKALLIKKMGGVDTPDKRTILTWNEAEKFKAMLFIP